MGSRALVAYDHGGRYDLHRSQWGARRLALRWRLTPATPFGGGEPPPVDPVASHTRVDPETIASVLDPPVHEAFYLVGPGFDVQAYVLARTDLPDQSDACGTRPTTGLLAAPIDTDRDGNQLRARIEGARSVVRAVLALIEPKSGVRDESEHDERWSKSDADARIDANEFGTDEVEAVLHRALQKSIVEWAARTIPLESIDDGTF